MDKITKVAENYGLKVIEDCAHSIESSINGKPVGTFGEFGCFSFYVTKNVATGEGGMVLTSSKDAADRIKILALHGMSADAWMRFSDKGYKHYQVVTPGFKYNMMDIQAALGIHQLRRVEKNWQRREQIWQYYREAFSDLPITLPPEAGPGERHSYHLFTILVEKDRTGISRDLFMAEMTRHKIGVGVHYRSIASHQYYCETFGWREEQFPVSHWVGDSTVSLPLSPRLSDEDVNDVVTAVREIIKPK